MATSLVQMEASEWDRFDYMISMWEKLCGGKRPGFQNNTFMVNVLPPLGTSPWRT
jgi:hypothetical protein